MRGRRFTALPHLWPELTARARAMRAAPTADEARLWHELRGRRFLGLKFRRQHPVGPYVVDFLCPERGLVVEVDGSVHERTPQEDALRQSELEAMGLRVFRCRNEDVAGNLQHVLSELARFVDVEAP